MTIQLTMDTGEWYRYTIEKVKKAPKMKKAKGPAAECSMGKCEDEKKEGEKDKKADGVTGATRK